MTGWRSSRSSMPAAATGLGCGRIARLVPTIAVDQKDVPTVGALKYGPSKSGSKQIADRWLRDGLARALPGRP